MQQRINKLAKLGSEIIGPRLENNHCVFCGEEIEKGGYCYCKKAEKINPKVKKLRNLLDRYSYVTNMKEFIHQQITQANFPQKFAGMEFSDYVTETEEQKHNLELTENYVQNALKHYLEATNLIFVGNFGNGKTMLMSIAGDEIIRQYGIQIKYVNVYDLSEKIKKTFERKDLSTSNVIDAYKEAPILILDDIDKVQPTPWVCDLMYGFSNYRGDNKLPTWINANHSLEELSNNFFGEGAISRFFDNSVKAKFTGENWRLRMQKEKI